MRFNQKARFIPCALALCLALLGSAASGRAEISTPGSPPSQAVPLTLHVPRGEAITIKLSVFGPPEPVTFLIRGQPRFGKLSASSVEGRGDALIVYRHSGEKYETQDRFTYAAKTSAGVSPAAEVIIAIDDPPAKLTATDRLDFGDVPVGETKELVVEVSNAGGAPASGTANTESPWQVREGASYRIPGQTKQKLHLVFTPDHVGPVESSLVFSSDRTIVTELYGRGVESFYLDSGTLNLKRTNAKPPLTTTVIAHNRLRETLTLQIAAPAPFQVPPTLQIPPLGQADLTITAPAGQLAPLDDFVTVSDGAFTGRLHVLAPAAPAVPTLDQPKLEFGQVEAAKTSTANLTVKNTGGSDTLVTAILPAPFTVAEADQSFDLAPGASHAISISFTPTHSGPATATLTLQSDAGNLTAICTADALPAPAIIAPRATYDVAEAASKDDTTSAPPEFSKTPAVKTLRATLIKPTSVSLEWTAPNPAPARYEVQLLTLWRNASGRLSLEWRPVLKPNVRSDSARITARLTGLNPRQFVITRVVAIDSQGLPTKPSPEVRVQTPPRSWPSLLQWLLLALLVLAGIIVRNKWRHRNDPISGF